MPEDGDGSEELGGCPVLEVIENMSATNMSARVFPEHAWKLTHHVITRHQRISADTVDSLEWG